MKENHEDKSSQSDFHYFLCNEGSEKYLKEEVKLIYPELVFSFSTPGFLTFKEKRPLGKKLRPVFCRHFGNFVAKANSFSELKHLLPEKYLFYSLQGDIYQNYNFKNNEWVYEVIEINKSMYYLGKFWSDRLKPSSPGGLFKIDLPKDAPSRAYLKIEEAIHYLQLNLKPNEAACEIGASPGGACFALLQRGLFVEGIDSGEMHSACINNPNFTHHKVAIQEFNLHQLKRHVEWLLVDMNLAPEASLGEVEKIIMHLMPSLKGVFFTLKMTQFSLVKRVPMYLTIIQKMGLEVILATQLQSHKQEFLVFARGQNRQ